MSNPYPACTSCRDGLAPSSCAWSTGLTRDGDCRAHVAWEQGYAAAAQPTWTRVDLERPETFPPGWELHVSVEAPASPWPEEVIVWRSGMRRPQALSRVKNGDLWTPLPAPPKEEP